MKDADQHKLSSISDVVCTNRGMLNLAFTRARAASLTSGSSTRRSTIAFQPSASASGSPGGTTIPVSPTTWRASPTSVTTHGTPHDIASATQLGVPSPREDEQHMSRARYADGMSSTIPVHTVLSSTPCSLASVRNSHTYRSGPPPIQTKRASGLDFAKIAAAFRKVG